MHGRLHADELSIDSDLVRRLVASQYPENAALPLTPLPASGSTNRLYRLGDELLVRLPRQPGGSVSVDKERQWTAEMGRHLPVAVPEIMHVGRPEFDYPEQWSIVRWLDGRLPSACGPDSAPAAERLTLAAELADVIRALRAIPVPQAARTDPVLQSYRGRPLIEFDRAFRRAAERCRSIEEIDLDLDAAMRVWTHALALPAGDNVSAGQWFHSDLVAENLLLNDGHLTAVLDFGGLAIGDPTIDLHGAWELFDPPALAVFREALNVSDAQWLRGRAWALGIALMCFSYYWETMPGRCSDRLAMARSVLADAA